MLMDLFDYQNHFFHRLTVAHDPASPIQGELHPGPHCDLYRCPHCYGLGQSVLQGKLVSAEEIDRALADVEHSRPTIIVSGITTEPLTHPDAAGIIRAVRRRQLPLGLYTKGRRLTDDVRRALLEDGSPETFVTLSLDSVSAADYLQRHNIPADRRDGMDGTKGIDYFDIVLDNLKRLRTSRDATGSSTSIRGAFLLFSDSAKPETVAKALEVFGPYVDLLRFAIPQLRNDGELPGMLPNNTSEILRGLARTFANEPKVKILVNTENPQRDYHFNLCRSQRFQFVIDKAGNVFPCPQVAVYPYRHLSYGNIRKARLLELLNGPVRRKMFALDVDRDMRCRICDRKDEAVNIALGQLSAAYD
jgi:radical SAM protein with 4Fe4S-binding SPASM domain